MQFESLEKTSLVAHWPLIREVVLRGQRSSLYCSIATRGADGYPNVRPIGTVFLNEEPGGFFFDRYTSKLSEDIAVDARVCLMSVNSGKWFWLTSMLKGRFKHPPGVRLYGVAGPLREATEHELRLINARVGPSLRTKGGRMLWSSFRHVRDVEFHAYRPVQYPVMMNGMWSETHHPSIERAPDNGAHVEP